MATSTDVSSSFLRLEQQLRGSAHWDAVTLQNDVIPLMVKT